MKRTIAALFHALRAQGVERSAAVVGLPLFANLDIFQVIFSLRLKFKLAKLQVPHQAIY